MKLVLCVLFALSLSSLFASSEKAPYVIINDNVLYDEKQNSDKKNTNTIVLSKNIQVIGGKKKNILTQDMFNKECGNDGRLYSNTIFVIKYKYDLNGQTINIPNGARIVFRSGGFNNGTVNGNYSKYEGNGFGKDLIYKDFVKYNKGIIKVEDLANCNTTSNIDNYDNYNLASIINYTIRECAKEYGSAKVVFNGDKTYGFKSPIFLLDNVTIEGNGCHMVFPSNRSAIYSMDGVQAFITNRIHTSIEGRINKYTTTITGSKNMIIRNVVFANVDEMKNFGFQVNCERGLIALCGAENVQIDGVQAENINTAHCAVWCNNIKNLEVKNCFFSQDSAFDSNGTGGFWTSGSEYVYNVSIHHNNFVFFGDESINIEMKASAEENDINISNNYIKGSLLTTIHNYDKKNAISTLVYSDNILDDVTGIVNEKHQGNPRLLMIDGDIDSIDYRNNNITVDTETNLVSFYHPSYIKKIKLIENEVKGEVGIIDNNSAYLVSCNVEKNQNLVYAFNPNASTLKDALITNNVFSLNTDIVFNGCGAGSTISLIDNVFKSVDNRKRHCILGTNRGKFRIEGNTFVSSNIKDTINDKGNNFMIGRNTFSE